MFPYRGNNNLLTKGFLLDGWWRWRWLVSRHRYRDFLDRVDPACDSPTSSQNSLRVALCFEVGNDASCMPLCNPECPCDVRRAKFDADTPSTCDQCQGVLVFLRERSQSRLAGWAMTNVRLSHLPPRPPYQLRTACLISLIFCIRSYYSASVRLRSTCRAKRGVVFV